MVVTRRVKLPLRGPAPPPIRTASYRGVGLYRVAGVQLQQSPTPLLSLSPPPPPPAPLPPPSRIAAWGFFSFQAPTVDRFLSHSQSGVFSSPVTALHCMATARIQSLSLSLWASCAIHALLVCYGSRGGGVS